MFFVVLGCAWTLCCILVQAGDGKPVRQLAGVILRQMVNTQWEKLAVEERAHTKGILLNVLLDPEVTRSTVLSETQK